MTMASSFKSALLVRSSIRIDGEEWWTIEEDMVYELAFLGSGLTITVPAFFETTLASVPLLRPDGRTRRAAALHDWLYQHPFVFDGRKFVELTRKECDEIFHEAMLVDSVPEWKAKVYYAGTRVGGWKAWDGYREADRAD